MRKITILLILTLLALASLAAITVVGFYVLTSSPYPPGWIDQMGSMMTGEMSNHMPTQSSLAPYFGLLFVVLIGIAVAGVAGMAYFLVMPEIRITKHKSISATEKQNTGLAEISDNQLTPFDAVLRTLNPTERKVVQLLQTHNGKYLQKYIRNDTGLSRLQIHRTVAGLVQKGIVSAEQSGNTNVVILESWLLHKKT